MMRCASCDEPIVGSHIYHYRLDVHVHGTVECMRDVRGEDIRFHTVKHCADTTAGKMFLSSALSATETITVGAAGAGDKEQR